MQAPIPDPFSRPAPPKWVKGPRPPLLIWMIGLSWLVNLAIDLGYGVETGIGWTVTGYAIGLLVDYCLWQGQNWARILTLVGCAFAIFIVFGTDRAGLTRFLLELLRAAFYAAYAVYLTRPPTVAFTRGERAQA